MKKNSITDLLASSLGRNDEEPNIDLAKKIVAKKDKNAVQVLIDQLNNKNKSIQSDIIKVLYEIAERNPEMITDYLDVFVKLLSDKNNRMQWGAMSAIDSLTNSIPEKINKLLPHLIDAADNGTVITRDRFVNILIKLMADKKYYKNAWELYIEQLKCAPVNQLPMYSENALHLINEKNKSVYIKTLQSRISDIDSSTKLNRIEKILSKIKNK